jgi:thiamine biosynthesis lipoprotein
MRRSIPAWLRWAGSILWLASTFASSESSAEEARLTRFRYTQTHMGVPVEVLLYAADSGSANTAAAAAFEKIGELDRRLSDYKAESELSKLSDTAGLGKAVPVGPELWLVLSRAQDLARRSEGAFDVTVGPLVKLWRRARRAKEFPSPARLAEARAAVGYEHLRLDPKTHTATLVQPGMRLDLGGIAMGYAADEALAVLRKHGVTRALIDGSGDIVVGDPPPDASGWKIGIAPLDSKAGPPSRYVLLANAAVTTSGDAWQYVELNGRRYSHIVDPHTGLGLTTRSSVTIIARDCITADSLATAVSVLGPTKGLALVGETPGTAAFIVTQEAGHANTFASPNLEKFLAPD